MTYWIGNKNIKQYLTEDELKELEEIDHLLKIINTNGEFDKYLESFTMFYIENENIYKIICNRAESISKRPATEEEIELLKVNYQIIKTNYLMVKDKKDYYLNKKKSLMDIFINGVDNDFKNHRKLYMRKYRRNKNGLTSREQKKQDLINSIKSLNSEGMKQKDIAEKLGINKSTVSRYLKL